MTGSCKVMFSFFCLFLCWNVFSISAQENISGVIHYNHLYDYQLDGAYDDPRWSSYIADLPKSGNIEYILTFSTSHSLYIQNPSSEEPDNYNLRLALKKVNYMKSPKPETIKVFRKYKDKRQVEQIGFMTKTFLVDSDLKRVSWKLTHMKKQVLEYECMGAEIKEGEEIVTAYFSPEIPASVGPAKYYGLPGAILSIEINGNPMIIASSIQLGKVGDPISIDAPQDGKRMSLQEFEILVEEKTKEYNTNMDAKAKSKAKKPIKN